MSEPQDRSRAQTGGRVRGLEVDAPRVGIVMGSKSDMAAMDAAAEELTKRDILHEVRVMSAHRDPDVVADYAKNAKMRGLRVIIAGAGLSAALPGVVAAHTTLPVIGVPLTSSKSIAGGLDALLSIAQMPPGVPVRLRGRGQRAATRPCWPRGSSTADAAFGCGRSDVTGSRTRPADRRGSRGRPGTSRNDRCFADGSRDREAPGPPGSAQVSVHSFSAGVRTGLNPGRRGPGSGIVVAPANRRRPYLTITVPSSPAWSPVSSPT